MPHTRKPPSNAAEILATAIPDPEWSRMLEDSPIPQGSDWGEDTSDLKHLSEASLPRLRATLNAKRSDDVVEVEVNVDIPSTDLKPQAGRNRCLVIYPKILKSSAEEGKDDGWPLVTIFHGGGHTIGNPESELPLARLLVQKHQAVVVLPTYRLAPDHKFPTTFNDAFETLKQIASDTDELERDGTDTKVLPADLRGKIDASSGFIIGGTSAGATIAMSISQLYHKWKMAGSAEGIEAPPLTGLFICCGTCINPVCVPAAYQELFLSREQNKDCLPYDKDLSKLFTDAYRPQLGSPIWASMDQHPQRERDKVGDDHRWMEEGYGVRVYFQVCGQDISRDDGLIYERVLREEVGVETRLDLYSGFGHVFWGVGGGYAEMEMSKKRMQHSLDAVGWLLRREP